MAAAKVGLLHLAFAIPGSTSLKDKRRAVKSFKDRLAARHNVSVAEVDSLDNCRRAVLAVAMVANDGRYIESALQAIVNAATMQRDILLLEHEISWL